MESIHSKTGSEPLTQSESAPPDISALTQKMIHGLQESEGLPALCKILAEYLHSGVGILDLSGELVTDSFYVDCSPEQKELLRRHMVSQGGSEVQSLFRLSSQLIYSGKKAGVLAAARFQAPYTEEDRMALNQAAGFLCIQLAQEKRIADIELRLKGNFIEDLVSARYSDPESIINRAKALNYNIMAPHRVLVATIDGVSRFTGQSGHEQNLNTQLKTDIVHMIQSSINQTARGMVVAGRDEFIIIIELENTGSDITALKTMSEKLAGDVKAAFKLKMYIGIGGICNKLSDFSESYGAARRALEIGEYMITEGQVRSFEQFKVHALFLSTLKPEELYSYASEQLDPLLKYDNTHGTDFLKTLQEFLYLRNNVEGTAKALNMSVSGLKYRLRKIEKILDKNLKDYKLCFDLQLALVILQLFGKNRFSQ